MPEAQIRARVIEAQGKYLHVREDKVWSEKTKSWVYTNRGKELDVIQRRAGCPLGCYWCGAYMTVLFADVGIDVRKDFGVKNPLAVRDWFAQTSKIIYTPANGNRRVGLLPQRGDLIRMFSSHIEMYNGDDWLKDVARKRILCGGGNTGGNGGHHGVYVTERPLSIAQYIVNYITPYARSRL